MTAITNGSSAFYDQLTPENAAMLLIDHQAGLFLVEPLYDFLADIAAIKA
ncbi:MAG: hypothetical protein DSM106950_27320 [Stigonema ocellatum SAG 48.90 = DSM 106950]|nr:hypothetical protein [Stigonema ocellatum SAG 48.90 = DSM 106950]